MDVVLLFNGAGNQMSQYAFYRAKKISSPRCRAIYYKATDDHYGYELERMFGICQSNSLLDKVLLKLYTLLSTHSSCFLCRMINKFGVHIIHEDMDYTYNPGNLEPGTGLINFYWGGWHSEKYYQKINNNIRIFFEFNHVNEDDAFCRVYDSIVNHPCSVAVHIRRGDYVDIPDTSYYQFGNVATRDYYESAISFVNHEYPNASFFFFSDDIPWCKSNFKGDQFFFVECNVAENSWRDMFLISKCNHHIIANSTFSWWGAWLSSNDGITVRPNEFIKGVMTKDLYPEKWIQVNY